MATIATASIGRGEFVQVIRTFATPKSANKMLSQPVKAVKIPPLEGEGLGRDGIRLTSWQKRRICGSADAFHHEATSTPSPPNPPLEGEGLVL
jgi:hypothetical protein